MKEANWEAVIHINSDNWGLKWLCIRITNFLSLYEVISSFILVLMSLFGHSLQVYHFFCPSSVFISVLIWLYTCWSSSLHQKVFGIHWLSLGICASNMYQTLRSRICHVKLFLAPKMVQILQYIHCHLILKSAFFKRWLLYFCFQKER